PEIASKFLFTSSRCELPYQLPLLISLRSGIKSQSIAETIFLTFYGRKTMEMQPDEDLLFDLAELYKIFGDSTRIKILFALKNCQMAVNDIAENLKMTQSAISHQLRILKANKLVKFRRDGKSLIYSLDDEHVEKILNMGIAHLSEQD
ncbi:MAG: metalloregulator ArsR/SmtB family transcription factor, partial [Treponema sp.]|nr:metalloregulator ArsR/SmtB family transcription factor [Treponema sp.]